MLLFPLLDLCHLLSSVIFKIVGNVVTMSVTSNIMGRVWKILLIKFCGTS